MIHDETVLAKLTEISNTIIGKVFQKYRSIKNNADNPFIKKIYLHFHCMSLNEPLH